MALWMEPFGPAKITTFGRLAVSIERIPRNRLNFTELDVLFLYQKSIFHIVAQKTKCARFLVIEFYGIGCQERLALSSSPLCAAFYFLDIM